MPFSSVLSSRYPNVSYGCQGSHLQHHQTAAVPEQLGWKWEHGRTLQAGPGCPPSLSGSRWPCGHFGHLVGTRWPLRSTPTLTIIWFFDSKYWLTLLPMYFLLRYIRSRRETVVKIRQTPLKLLPAIINHYYLTYVYLSRQLWFVWAQVRT